EPATSSSSSAAHPHRCRMSGATGRLRPSTTRPSCESWPQADMRILVSFLRLNHPGGSEVYALTVAEQLERLGHDATLVTWTEGAMSERARSRGLRVIAPDTVTRGTAEVIVASDAATLLTLAERDPSAVRIMV